MSTPANSDHYSDLIRRFPEMREIVKHYGLPDRIRRGATLGTLVHVILEQQVSVPAAKTLYGRLKAGLGGMSAARLRDAGEPGLRRFGLTRQKSRYCFELGKAICERRFSLTRLSRLPDDEAIAELKALPGIGPWTAAIYLMNALERDDVWPPGDLALKRAIEELLPAAHHAQERTGERWAPYRSYAAELLWLYYRNTRG